MNKVVTIEDLKQSYDVKVCIQAADDSLSQLGYTEHGERHANLVAHMAENVLRRLGHAARRAELAAMAGYLHDIGNMVNRIDHGQTGALIAWDILRGMRLETQEIAPIVAAIGNHEADSGDPVNDMAAALILADKADVHRSRVRTQDTTATDIHDRVNYAAQHSFLRVNEVKKTITLEVTIDTQISALMDYFEIFLSRMLASRRAAKFLDCNFELMINKVKLL
ncbi:MAG: HDIG domain-containing protein [Dehalococcoidia bacterium]|nr:HDIG domain-containing protein [Dehalococcoidia bacterium]